MDSHSLQNVSRSLPLQLDPKRLPRHVAVIPDGNVRWTKANGLSAYKGLSVLRDIARISNQWGIEVLTAFAFSTDNFKRPKAEVEFVLEHLDNMFTLDHPNTVLKDGLKVRCIGDMSKLPRSLQAKISEAHEMTRDSKDLKFILAIAYGGWEDVLQACQRIASEVEQGVVKANDIDQCYLRKKMLLTEWDEEVGDPDLLIRTSGEQRLSNYLMNNLSYTELVFTEKLWPDFNEEDYVKAVVEFQERNRRYGRHDN
ncbi:hypothetical protein SELMODRAFT_236294 [Selaginella moellendorffii]|uniref:Alkyl transferase n=1 Tax=Selaginella moellendorffii TaxID=88036 RepID=D8T789_SELML|nr:uncharacterized protein LOC9639526 [Selaginella moellendorffii]EFJ07575.1 hypothetical protein SELMODRAFT_236294 [Selaginella moellendorffii]|eukprot:XP_002991463.1 uncharacterized protein LOC9639526 [Selaginella moellendorffii]